MQVGQLENYQIVRMDTEDPNSFFSFTHEKLAQMIEMMTEMPPDGCSHNRGHKHPFTVAEIFGCEVSQINDLFFTKPPERVTAKSATPKLGEQEPTSGTSAIKKMMADDSNSDEDNDGSRSSDEEETKNGQADQAEGAGTEVPGGGKKVRKSLKNSLVAHGYDEEGGGLAQEMPTVYQDSDEDDDGEVQVEVEDDSNPTLMATIKHGRGTASNGSSDDDRSPLMQEDDAQGFYQEDGVARF